LHGDIVTSFKAHPLGIPMYLGFTAVALGSLYGNIKGVRLMIDSKWASKIFIWFVAIFFVFGAVRMLSVTHYSGTAKEKIWRAALGDK
jgi:protein-S-isoprenylcysteine O-methyltransferase Ste14